MLRTHPFRLLLFNNHITSRLERLICSQLIGQTLLLLTTRQRTSLAIKSASHDSSDL